MYIIGMHRDEMVLFKASVGMRVAGALKEISSPTVIGQLSTIVTAHWMMKTKDIFLADWVLRANHD